MILGLNADLSCNMHGCLHMFVNICVSIITLLKISFFRVFSFLFFYLPYFAIFSHVSSVATCYADIYIFENLHILPVHYVLLFFLKVLFI